MTQATSAPVERKGPNYELLKDAYQIIDGIPEEAFDLEFIVRAKGRSKSCGTIACAAGWLAMHPKFNALGLKLRDNQTGPLSGVQTAGNDYHFFGPHMAGIFNISVQEAEDLFGRRGTSCYDVASNVVGISDKELWKTRVIAFLTEHNALTPKVPA